MGASRRQVQQREQHFSFRRAQAKRNGPEQLPGAHAAMALPLVVFIVFFGALPPWLPLTLQSMAANRNVSFVVIGDAPAPAADAADEVRIRVGLHWHVVDGRVKDGYAFYDAPRIFAEGLFCLHAEARFSARKTRARLTNLFIQGAS